MSIKRNDSYVVRKVYDKKTDTNKFLIEVEKLVRENKNKKIVVEVHNKYIGKSFIDFCALTLVIIFLTMVAVSWFTNILK